MGNDNTRKPAESFEHAETLEKRGSASSAESKIIAETRDTEGTVLNIVDEAEGRLPVERYEQEIMEAIRLNDVTIITAGTGAGKTTLIGQFLAKRGYKAVITQPRRVAASTLARRVAEQMKVPLGGKVGYRTATERHDSKETEIFFCTDGLQLVRELMEYKEAGYEKVLVIDEIHEWNMNMEVLAAWAKQRLNNGDALKVVIMSATLQAEELGQYFNNDKVKSAHIDVPGRLYPVKEFRKPAYEVISSIVELAEQGRNILVFQPGKSEINDTIQQLKGRLGDKAVIFPLHRELSDREQRECFKPVPPGKVKIVVSTNVAQTSVTIPDIDAVVDTGTEKQMGLNAGVKHLRLVPTSKKDCEQRKGRAGRTKPGVYIFCSSLDYDERPDYSVPEILRSNLDDMVLQLARHGFDAENLSFFHQPDLAAIKKAKEFLKEIGALNEKGIITPVGKRMAMIPLVPRYARMMIEAKKNGIAEEVATITAILEAGDLRRKSEVYPSPWMAFTKETQSDLLVLLDLFETAQNIAKRERGNARKALEEAGLSVKNFFYAKDIKAGILDAMRSYSDESERRNLGEAEKRREILKSCLVGLLDHVYRRSGSIYNQGDFEEGNLLARESICNLNRENLPSLIVGLPIKVPGKTRKGKNIMVPLLTMATEVDLPLLREIAPHLITTQESGELFYDRKLDSIAIKEEVYFKGKKIMEMPKAKPGQPNAALIFAHWLAFSYSDEDPDLHAILSQNCQINELIHKWNRRNGKLVFKVIETPEAKADYFQEKLKGATSISEIKDFKALLFPEPDQELIDLILADNPDCIEVAGYQIPVEYEYDPPRAIFNEKTVSLATLLELPDDDIFLPGGRKVEFVLRSYWNIVYANSFKIFKNKLHKHYNLEVWQNWKGRPELVSPDLEDDRSVIPPIATVEIGKSVINNEALKAYGTVAVKASSGNPFETLWFMDQESAEETRQLAVQTLEKLKEEWKVKQEREKLREAANDLLEELLNHRNNYDLSQDLRREIGSYGYVNLDRKSTDELRSWIEKTTAFLALVQDALVEIEEEKRRQELKRKLEEQREAEKLEKYGVQGELYDIAKQLTDCAIGIRGVKGAQLLLDHQLQASYEKQRRQDAIKNILGNPNGFLTSFYYLDREENVNAVLGAALKMVHERQSPPSKKGVSEKVAAPSPAKPLTGKLDLSALQEKFGKGKK